MKKILVLTNSSGGLYDFRGEFIEALCAEYEVWVSMPDDVKEKELTALGCHIIKTPINRRGINPLEDLKLYRSYSPETSIFSGPAPSAWWFPPWGTTRPTT